MLWCDTIKRKIGYSALNSNTGQKNYEKKILDILLHIGTAIVLVLIMFKCGEMIDNHSSGMVETAERGRNLVRM